jgi:hypothetical protein
MGFPSMPENRAKIRWDLIIAGASFALSLLGYLHPVDPTHPVTLDFLSKAITLPLWLLAISVLTVVSVTVVVLRFLRKPSDEVTELKKQLAAANAKLLNKKPDYGVSQGTIGRSPGGQPEPKPDPKPLSPVLPSPLETLEDQLRKQHEAQTKIVPATAYMPAFDPKRGQIVVEYKEGLSLELTCQENGIVMAAINRTANYIDWYYFDIAEAANWIDHLHTFLPPVRINRRPITHGEKLPPVHKTGTQWMIRIAKKDNVSSLYLYNDDSTRLMWPNNDNSQVQIWKLTIAGAYNEKAGEEKRPLDPIYLLVRWDREHSTIMMAQYQGR